MLNFGFIMEQTLGHVTHHQNLARWVEEAADICPVWMPIHPHAPDRWDRMPGLRSNWSLQGSLRARDALRAELRTTPLDALFVHTQTLTLFLLPYLRRIPSIISLDATTINYDTVGAHYGHRPSSKWLERRKFAWNQSAFHAATALVTWCRWARDSLVADYGIPKEKVTVIPPGIDLDRWHLGAERSDSEEGPLRLLFVGGDFARKGGPTLVDAYRSALQGDCRLDIVTRDEQAARDLVGIEGLQVHIGLTANSAPLRALYAHADLFVFPTEGDCLPIAVMEAMAAGLPVIATRVGALSEEVEDGLNGLMIPPGDPGALAAAVRALAHDPARRRAMGAASLQIAEERFDARRNYNAILSLMRALTGEASNRLEHKAARRV